MCIDGTSSFLTTDNLVNHVFSVPTGTHRITVKAWDAIGPLSTSQYVTVEAGLTSCSNKTYRSVLICSPQNGSTVSSPCEQLCFTRLTWWRHTGCVVWENIV